MATYTHEYQSTKKFYFDLDQSFVVRQAAPYIDESQDKVGVVVNVLMKLWLRVSAGANITRSNMKFILFKYNSSLLPSSWTARGGKCYRYASDSASFTYDAEKFKPYLLATSETFTKTWKSEASFDVNFIPTELGKKIENWNGRICLAVSAYGSGSGSSSTTTHCYWPWISNKHGSYYTLQYAQESPLINLNSSSFKLGTTSTVTIAPYSTTYKHKVTWELSKSVYHTSDYIPAGTTKASYTLPKSWRSSFGEADNTKSGKIIVATYDASGNQIGDSKEYSVTYTIDDYNYNNSITITNGTINNSIIRTTRTGRFTNSIFNNYLISGYDTFYVPVSVDFSSYSSKSKSISVKYNSITKSKNVEASSITSADTDSLLHTANSTSVLMQVKVTDKRGKTGVLDCGYSKGNAGTYKDICSYTYLTYKEPQKGTVSFYRTKANGTKDDLGGLYGAAKFSNYKASSSDPSLTSITNTIKLTVKDSQGTKVGEASTTVASGDPTKEIILRFRKTSDPNSDFCQLSLDEEYTISGTITDLSGYSQSISGKIFSSGYLLHFRYKDENGSVLKQKSVGIGLAGRDLSPNSSYSSYNKTGLLSIAFPIELPNSIDKDVNNFTKPLRIEDGGTGFSTATSALAALGGFPLTGGTLTGNLTIAKNQTIYLTNSEGSFSALYAGTNFYVGLGALAGLQKHGKTYIGLGRTLNNDGTYTINRDLYLRQSPTADNENDGETYTVCHSGNIFYSVDDNKDGIPDNIPGGKSVKGMIWLKPIT